MSEQSQALVDQLAARVAELTQALNETIAERDKTKLLFKFTTALSQALDFKSIASAAISCVDDMGATAGEIHLLTDTGQAYFKSTFRRPNSHAGDEAKETLGGQLLAASVEAWVFETGQPALLLDTNTDERWVPIEPVDQQISVRSCICAPLNVEPGRLKGTIAFVHHQPNYFDQQDLTLLDALAAQVTIALQNTTLLNDLQGHLQETRQIVDISHQFVAAKSLTEVYAALTQGVLYIGADRCTLNLCDDLDIDDIPKFSQIVYVNNSDTTTSDQDLGFRFSLAQYPLIDQLVRAQETIIIQDVAMDERLTDVEQDLLSKSGARSAVIHPLVLRGRVIGLIIIQYKAPHIFDDRELALYQTLCNQAIIAIENARQMQRMEMALTETQSLYRAGRVLAGTTSLEEILQESLVEFLYSLNLDQGGIILLTPDRRHGELVAYVQNGQPQEVGTQKFPIGDGMVYQQTLISGQPFASVDVPNDPRLAGFKHFNIGELTKSLVQAPIIIRGETIGWIGADSVQEYREFSQRETDLARAMADQIAIAIQNRHLLEKSERQAEQLKAVAQVGKSVSQLIDLDRILRNTVELIRDQFGFYHVSIFLLDEARQWAVVRASTGEVGKIMVKRPHRLEIGGRSIVGYVTASGTPRVALDVGRDRVHFNHPLLPNTRSEMALPLISRSTVIGALDVQSVEANAFSNDDVETLQIMADQLAAAIENARLFEQFRINLERTQALYRISEALASSTEPGTTFETLLGKYLSLLGLRQGSLMLVNQATNTNEAKARYIDGRAVESNLILPLDRDLVFQNLQQKPGPLVIKDTQNDPLTKDDTETRGQTQAQSMLFIPLIVRNAVVGSLVADTTDQGYNFSQQDIDLGEAIADQLALWLESRQLLDEAQYRSNLLQTAAEVSGAASSILDTDELINTTVNLIRDKFDFYYVGLFLVDETKKWAELHAGTGEAGQIQLKNKHKLRIGGESMIGWAVANRRARIASDVGEEDVHFRNPHLPDTHSEMALPLISRDEVIGALTVQSVERGAFSDEDISLLQTMADQLANVIANARLFESVARAQKEAEARLQETVALQELSQALSRTLQVNEILDIFFQACTKVIGFDYVQFSLVDKEQNRIKALAGIGVSEGNIKVAVRSLDSNDIMADIIRTGRTEVITGWDDRFDQETYQSQGHENWVRLFSPVTLRQENIGLVEAGFNRNVQAEIDESQIRLLRAFVDQTVLALDNAQRYEASRRAAQREEIIREITSKIRSSVDVEDILKTTVSELSKVLGSSRGGIMLNTSSPESGTGLEPAVGPPDTSLV